MVVVRYIWNGIFWAEINNWYFLFWILMPTMQNMTDLQNFQILSSTYNILSHIYSSSKYLSIEFCGINTNNHLFESFHNYTVNSLTVKLWIANIKKEYSIDKPIKKLRNKTKILYSIQKMIWIGLNILFIVYFNGVASI